MPIRAGDKRRYPADWKAISQRIRFDRADGRCECDGRCGGRNCLTRQGGDRCTATHGDPHPVTGSKVVLTTAHMNHTPEDCRDENLLAMCQACHLAYDRDHHRESRKFNDKHWLPSGARDEAAWAEYESEGSLW